MSAILEVKWNGKRFPLEFESAQDLQQTTVKELKSLCQRITGADPSTMKINAFGAIMNNDDLPLTVYGLRPGCYVTLKLHNSKHKHGHRRKSASREPASEPPQPKKSEQKPKQVPKPEEPKQEATGEEALLEQLKKIQSKIDTDLTPQTKTYEKNVKEFLSKPSKTDKEKKKQVYMGAYIGEQLMHVLFDLDGFICGPDNLNARQARKEAVKSAQALLDKVDEIKSVVKNVKVEDE